MQKFLIILIILLLILSAGYLFYSSKLTHINYQTNKADKIKPTVSKVLDDQHNEINDTAPSNNFEPTEIEKEYIDPYKSLYSSDEAKKIIETIAYRDLVYLENNNFSALSDRIHPETGIKFQHNLFSKSEYINALAANTQYPFYFGGSGEPTNLSISEYLKKIIKTYDHDGKFSDAPNIFYNEFRDIQSETNMTIDYFGTDAIEVEFFFPGTEHYAEHDFDSLQLIYSEYEDQFYLVSIIHRTWSV